MIRCLSKLLLGRTRRVYVDRGRTINAWDELSEHDFDALDNGEIITRLGPGGLPYDQIRRNAKGRIESRFVGETV